MHPGSLTHVSDRLRSADTTDNPSGCVLQGGQDRARDYKMCVTREERRRGPAPRVRGRRARYKAPLAMQSMHACVTSILLRSCSARLACAFYC